MADLVPPLPSGPYPNGGKLTAPIHTNLPGPKSLEEEPLLPQAGKRRGERGANRTLHYNLSEGFLNALVPPLLFLWTCTLLTFRLHFTHVLLVWFLILVAFLPAFVLASGARTRAALRGAPLLWYDLMLGLFSLALLLGCAAGVLNYLYFMHPYYYIQSMKTYSNVDPAGASGQRLMDAGMLHFTNESRVATDLAMSYTSYDVYCVAPITTSAGMPSQNSQLAFYDLWAVGVNCCDSGMTNFRCGKYNSPSVHSGLRQVTEDQRHFFRLAVEQAEAAYNIQSRHPLFLFWVQDPDLELRLFFALGFRNWVLANGVHFAANLGIVLLFMFTYNRASKFRGSSLETL